MHNDLFSIGPLTVHGYGLMIGLGVVAALCLSWRRAKVRQLDDDFVTNIAIALLLMGFLGAKVLYVIVSWKDFLADPWAVLGTEGFVIYGGIIGGLLAVYLYCRKKKESFFRWMDIIIPGVALAQGLGRIGCFLAGCCYGRPTDSCLGVVFPAGSMAPAGVPLLPTQLFSAAGDMLIAVILLLLDRKKHEEGMLTVWYLLMYAVGRFCIEFFRSDYRGAVGFLSTSQFISILIAALALLLAWRLKKRSASHEE